MGGAGGAGGVPVTGTTVSVGGAGGAGGVIVTTVSVGGAGGADLSNGGTGVSAEGGRTSRAFAGACSKHSRSPIHNILFFIAMSFSSPVIPFN